MQITAGPSRWQSTMTTTTDDLLLGADLREVRARYGAPLGCAFDGEALWLTYLAGVGDADEAAVRLVDGVVVDDIAQTGKTLPEFVALWDDMRGSRP